MNKFRTDVRTWPTARVLVTFGKRSDNLFQCTLVLLEILGPLSRQRLHPSTKTLVVVAVKYQEDVEAPHDASPEACVNPKLNNAGALSRFVARIPFRRYQFCVLRPFPLSLRIRIT